MSSLVAQLPHIDNTALLPDGLINDIDTQLKSLRTAIDALKQGIDSQLADASVASIDIVNLMFTTNRGQTIVLAKSLAKIYNTLQLALHATRLILAMVAPTSSTGLEKAVEEIATARVGLREQMTELAKLATNIQATEAQIKPIPAMVTQALSAAQADATKASEQRTSAESVAGEAAKQLTAIAEVGTKAKNLEAEVSAYDAKFRAFDTQLSGRETALSEANRELKSLLDRLDASMKDIEKTQARAREVLGEATVSGLSERFAKVEQDLGWRSLMAQILFFVGIVLFLFTGGVLLDMFPWLTRSGILALHSPVPPDNPTVWSTTIFLMASLVGKAMLLLPAIFLIAFSAKWYAALFRLREQYAYKYTVAASLPGFKVEAPQHAEAMTAVAFKELLYNPADEQKNEQPSRDGELSWAEKLLEPTVKKVAEKMLTSVEKR